MARLQADAAGAGNLRELVAFDSRPDLSGDSPPGDGYGNPEGDWTEEFQVKARIMPLIGSERVMADRLSGVQPVVIRVRYSVDAMTIIPGWRARDVRKGTVFNITGAANMDEKRQYIDVLATAGVAA